MLVWILLPRKKCHLRRRKVSPCADMSTTVHSTRGLAMNSNWKLWVAIALAANCHLKKQWFQKLNKSDSLLKDYSCQTKEWRLILVRLSVSLSMKSWFSIGYCFRRLIAGWSPDACWSEGKRVLSMLYKNYWARLENASPARQGQHTIKLTSGFW